MKLTVLPPTYNESRNIAPLVSAICQALDPLYAGQYEILFVDDSNDDTPEEIRKQMALYKHVRLIHREKSARNGLSMAFVDGFKKAKGEYIFCMDSDLQHPPEKMPEMLEVMFSKKGIDLVVASRYKPGGSADGLDGVLRRFVSRGSCLLSWIILPPTRKSSDPMTGFFLVKKSLVQKLDFASSRGFKILVDILVRSGRDLQVAEIPFVFRKRTNDSSKATFKQGINFFLQLLELRSRFYKSTIKYHVLTIVKEILDQTKRIALASLIVFVLGALLSFALTHSQGTIEKTVIIFTSILFIQGLFSVFLMLYAWEVPDRVAQNRAPKNFAKPDYSFTVLLPARHEKMVIADTIRSAAAIRYPEEMKEVLVLINDFEDDETIAIAKKTIEEVGATNIKLVTFTGKPINKPRGLNVGLKKAKKQVVTIFDAEDEIHPDIFLMVNTIFLRDKVDVIQAGVQLMNLHSTWFSLFNVLEYFFWFKSSLHFFSSNGMIPLGGNTVFFKRKWLKRVGGWDEKCLTEDADIGLRLSLLGAKTSIVYDEKYSTQEETPATVYDFLKQRTRWNQGFIQILLKGEWLRLPRLQQKILAFYVFSWPIFQGVLFLILPLSLLVAGTVKMAPFLSVYTNVPTYLLVVFLVVFNLGLHDFMKNYSLRYSPLLIGKTIIYFIPFFVLLGLAAFRAVYRQILGNNIWEKTTHFNLQRKEKVIAQEIRI